MSQPTDRDGLARHLYVTQPHGPSIPLSKAEQDAGALEWDQELVTADDVADCYARADAILAGKETTR